MFYFIAIPVLMIAVYAFLSRGDSVLESIEEYARLEYKERKIPDHSICC